MTFYELLILSVGLSMDAFAVSMTNTLVYRNFTIKNKIQNVVVFGVYHFVMIMLGFCLGELSVGLISKYDHWLALVLLGFIGGEMIVSFVKDYKAYKLNKNQILDGDNKIFHFRTLLVQGLAVSIDAIAVGLTLVTSNIGIIYEASIIAIVAMLFCVLGFFVGKRMGLILKHWSQLFGGLILVGIGIKIFLEHML